MQRRNTQEAPNRFSLLLPPQWEKMSASRRQMRGSALAVRSMSFSEENPIGKRLHKILPRTDGRFVRERRLKFVERFLVDERPRLILFIDDDRCGVELPAEGFQEPRLPGDEVRILREERTVRRMPGERVDTVVVVDEKQVPVDAAAIKHRINGRSGRAPLTHPLLPTGIDREG